MSQEPCRTCGATHWWYRDAQGCSVCHAPRESPTGGTEHCGKCGAPTSFAWDETEGWISVCCHWTEKALPADA